MTLSMTDRLDTVNDQMSERQIRATVADALRQTTDERRRAPRLSASGG
jgi:hypothetical protein